MLRSIVIDYVNIYNLTLATSTHHLPTTSHMQLEAFSLLI